VAFANSKPPAAITLDELLALNEEISALVRAGVPLEQGLAALGGDLPGRLGQIARTLADRAARGESLPQVLADQSIRLPSVYRAVVEAGLKAGRLPAALEALAGAIRRLSETQRAIVAASLYPLFVLILACGFFAFFSLKIAPKLLGSFEAFGVPGRAVFAIWTYSGRWAAYWGTLIPLAILILAGVWWYHARRAALVESRWSAVLLGWLPWVGRTLRYSRTATFAELLALLLENRVPLGQALVLAAEACGDPRLLPAAKRLAEATQRGESLAAAGTAAEGFPPLLRWLMAAGERQGALLPALKHAAETYRRRAQDQADVARVFLPVLLTAGLAGSVTLLYALGLFLPYTTMLRQLAGG
jgi:general secretion pathway protein F